MRLSFLARMLAPGRPASIFLRLPRRPSQSAGAFFGPDCSAPPPFAGFSRVGDLDNTSLSVAQRSIEPFSNELAPRKFCPSEIGGRTDVSN